MVVVVVVVVDCRLNGYVQEVRILRFAKRE
jgi:hypothetical protein